MSLFLQGLARVPVFGDDEGLFCRDHSSARETGFSLAKVLSGGLSGERASESG
jgi:hypothetical protein